ncbi:MAG TPA: VWA domain-containing protein, partial [Gemmatimonadales bacterium]
RAPINVALVLDRSGSMGGAPIAAAKAAARRFASFLGANDRLSVVAFDGIIETVYGPAPGGDGSAGTAIDGLDARGSTNLSGGWLKGMQLVKDGLVDGTNRVLLLTDGQANQGITDVDRLVGMAGSSAAERVSTSCIGFGAHFNERLLDPMAHAGGGNYWFVESEDQMTGIFESEIEGLVALSAQNVEVEVTLTHPRTAGVTFLHSVPVQATPDGRWRVVIGDLYATSPRPLGLMFHVEDVAELGKVEVAQVKIEADVVTPEGIAHRTIVMPVMANLDGTDRIEPQVEETLLRFRNAMARREAVRLADAGDYDAAARRLDDAVLGCAPYMSSPAVAEESRDLRAQAELLRERRYSTMDRKYDEAVSLGILQAKLGYVDKVRRRR